ncbi:DNA polymerase III subunit delta', partial [Pseudomonas syringae]|nr:DNA polymerase III subunit delta' [Pseudomonas syringae]
MAEAYPWQASLWQQMAGRAQPAHAYLLHGPAGIGNRPLPARRSARLVCDTPAAVHHSG